MIAQWILYALIVAALVSVAAAAADRLLRALRIPSRWLWVSALAFTAAWPIAALFRNADVPTTGGARASSPLAESLQSVTVVAARASERAMRIELDTALVGAWVLASLALALRLGHGVLTLARHRSGWRTESVDGVAIRVSENVGPAVVGLRHAEVVLPAWALALDAPLRAIVLRHEEEHRRAGDPWLLALAAVLAVLAPWNAAIWWQARRLRLAIELDCDARVLRADPAPERYGLLLLSIAQRRSSARPRLVAGLLEPLNHLERRITAMTPGAYTLSRSRAIVLGALAVTALVAACRADSPPGPASRAAAAPADSTRSVVLTEEGRVVPDSAMITITLAEYERLKAAAAKARVVDDVRVRRDTQAEPMVEQGVVAGAHWDFQVERPAEWQRGTGAPRYPDMLKAAGVQGTVLASFVVDTAGLADVTTLRILRSAHELFSVAVRNALPQMRFTPAEAGGRKVKQVIQQEFSFKLQ